MPESIFEISPSSHRSLQDLIELPDVNVRASEPLVMADGAVPPVSLQTHVRGLWSPSSLFILFSGRFLQLRMFLEDFPWDKAGKTLHLWEKSDVYEFMIGRECQRTRRYKEFQVAPDGRWFSADIRLERDHVITDREWNGVIRCISVVNGVEKVWKAAIEIPWAILGGREGEGKWRCNLYRATGKFHGDELLAWQPTGYGENCFHRPHLFGTMKILEDA